MQSKIPRNTSLSPSNQHYSHQFAPSPLREKYSDAVNAKSLNVSELFFSRTLSSSLPTTRQTLASFDSGNHSSVSARDATEACCNVPKSTAVTGRRCVTPLEMGRLLKVPDMGRRSDWVRWKDILDMVDLVPNVFCEEVMDIRRLFFLGEGRRRPEEWVLLFETELCVPDPGRMNLVSFWSRNSISVMS